TKGTVDDLSSLELAYAPPFSSAKDPVNIAGYVAGNILRQDMKAVSWDQVLDGKNRDFLLLDVRDKSEVEAGHLAGAVHIPLNKLRQRLHELPKDQEIVVYCQVGLRAYIGARILQQNGFKVSNLSGGWKTIKPILEDRQASTLILE
ncbi:MAG TPA: pyridine nucleotide-disulfide oxidoreductase, partial [Firmicutes bacterium]|nr:pyridine nucleotide-disulfide oxidoreductase [Bacillota bacterium]